MKKGDYIIIGIILLMITGLFVYNDANKMKEYDQRIVNISVNNELFETFVLDEALSDQIEIDTEFGHNHVIVENNGIYVEHSSCPDQICVLDGSISEPGGILVCLPNKMVIEIMGTKNTGVDEVSY